jgi:anti-anti-sigma factor
VESLLIDLAHCEGSDVLRLVGELDLAEANRAKRIAGTAIAAGTGPFVVDLSELTYCDSSGINVLLDIHRRAESCGRTVILRQPHPRVKRVLDLTAVTEQFVVDNDDPGARRVF